MNKILFLSALLILIALVLLTWFWMKEEPAAPMLPRMQEEVSSEEKPEIQSTPDVSLPGEPKSSMEAKEEDLKKRMRRYRML